MLNSMNGQIGGLRKEILEVKQEADLLKQRQMMSDHHLLFYDATLISFDRITNKWKIRCDDQPYTSHWTIAARIFQM
ncbi:unnamed protein product [Rotaria sp. Silwood1]|nr:unnamed protein product [Rotaria sp. Silwood1]